MHRRAGSSPGTVVARRRGADAVTTAGHGASMNPTRSRLSAFWFGLQTVSSRGG
jgi:hypothetical protein